MKWHDRMPGEGTGEELPKTKERIERIREGDRLEGCR